MLLILQRGIWGTLCQDVIVTLPVLSEARDTSLSYKGLYFRPAFQTWFRELELTDIRGGTKQIKISTRNDGWPSAREQIDEG